jgi:hypothetical protein
LTCTQGIIAGLNRAYFTLVLVVLQSASGYLDPEIVASADEVFIIDVQEVGVKVRRL